MRRPPCLCRPRLFLCANAVGWLAGCAQKRNKKKKKKVMRRQQQTIVNKHLYKNSNLDHAKIKKP